MKRSGRTTTEPAGVRSDAREPLFREQDRLLPCVHCGFCLPACPTYTRLGDEADSPRGRLYLMQAVTEDRLLAQDPAFITHIQRCLGCRACETACPAGVEYGFLLDRARALARKGIGQRAVTGALTAVFSRPRLARALLLLLRPLLWQRVLPRLLRLLPPRLRRARFALAMLAASRPASSLAAGLPAQPSAAAPPPTAAEAPGRRGRVAMLDGCVQRALFDHVNQATARVLRVNGFEVVPAPGQRCCGALHGHSGNIEAARRLARHNIAAFERTGADFIVVNAAGCGATMKEYGELLADDQEYAARAHALAGRVRDVTELLTADEPVRGEPLPLRVTCDSPCHLHHAQRVTTAPLQLLSAVPELELVPLQDADECCGGAGIYSLLNPDLGGRILEDKLAAIRATDATVVFTPNPGCIMQIGAGLLLAADPVTARHPIELLDESYRLAGLYGPVRRPDTARR